MNSGFLTVMNFTIRNKVRSKSFIITTIILALFVSIVVNLPYIITMFQSSDRTAYVGAIEGDIAARLEQFYAAQEEPDIVIRQFPDQGSQTANDRFLRDQIADGEIRGYLEFGEMDELSGFPRVQYKSTASLDFGFTSRIQTGLQVLKNESVAQDLPAEIVQRIMSPVVLETVQVSTTEGGTGSIGEAGKSATEVAIAMVMVYFMIIVLFMGIMITGQLIATEITSEKSSRIMELLITSVSPLNQMYGKIIGMLLVGLGQIGFIIAVGFVNVLLPHNIGFLQELGIQLSDISVSLLMYGVVFYILGYFLYATVYAAVGSIVSRTEELAQAMMPLTMLSLAGFYAAMIAINMPDAAFVKVMSYIPFFTPFLMFLRIGLTDPSMWEVLLSIVILLGSTLALGWLSAKIYRTGVLMYGKRPSLKELRKAMRAYKM